MLTRSPITVALARFEDLVSRGLRALIDEDESLDLVAFDVPHADLPATLSTHAPRVAMLNFGSLRNAGEVRELHYAHPSTHLVVLGNRPTPAESSQMLAFGATACLAKTTEARDVLNAIHLASRGLHVLPTTGSRLEGVSGEGVAGPELLTPREADVLDLLQRGRSNAEIAASLYVSVETVRTHARHIYRKLGVRTRRELHASR
ncbi:MAG TPA: response regulator transcription factor [Solirubrobacteraceae bacterium]|jgi:DNA-binding NarL/FixJ family response regulator|nr:response regulator transcription factor [Solirubrobacteraceae bacterium]